jgi:predicted nucleic acid-binding protein
VIVYIDTSIIVSPILDKGYEQKAAKKIFGKLQSRSNQYTKKIPQIVLGEAVSSILRKYNYNEGIQKITEFFHKIIYYLSPFDIIPLNENIVKIASKLRTVDNRIDFCDLLIIASAINDNADILLMHSSEVERSYKLNEAIQRYNKDLRISDSL